jgi:hypothetical protein
MYKVFKKNVVNFGSNHFTTSREQTLDFVEVEKFDTKEEAEKFVFEKLKSNPDYIRILHSKPSSMLESDFQTLFITDTLYYMYQDHFISESKNKLKNRLEKMYRDDNINVIRLK